MSFFQIHRDFSGIYFRFSIFKIYIYNFSFYIFNNGLNLNINSCFDMDLGPTVLLNS